MEEWQRDPEPRLGSHDQFSSARTKSMFIFLICGFALLTRGREGIAGVAGRVGMLAGRGGVGRGVGGVLVGKGGFWMRKESIGGGGES